MDVLPLSPLRVGSVVWRPRPDRWTLTVVCKATYALEPGESRLAREQDDVRERDAHWDDDPRHSVYAPSDLAPFKPRADIVLVGNAFAPRSELVRSLVARLVVGEVQKAVEVYCPRVLSPEGDLREGQRWSKMPLRYEYAAGGPDTWNPVGIPVSGPLDVYGQRPLPHLQPPDLRTTSWRDVFVPTGFGPLAPAWRARREKLGRRAEGWSDEGWTRLALDDDFDGEFFQVAPPDQQLESLREDERVVLEYLSADHPILTTRLTPVTPQAYVEQPGSRSRDLVMTADTLWIDTDRAVCTVTWRGQVAVDGPEQRGRVLVGTEGTARPLTRAYGMPDSGPPPTPQTAAPGKDEGSPPTPRGPRRTLQMLAEDKPVGMSPAAETPRTPGLRPTLPMFPDALPAWLAKPTTRAENPETTQVSRIPRLPAPADRVCEVLWATADLAPRLRISRAWAAIIGPDPSRSDAVAAVLARGKPSPEDLEDALFDAIGPEGVFSPSLLLLDGDLAWLDDAPASGGSGAPSLHDRPHQRRTLFGQAWIRARFEPKEGPSVPTYVPAAATDHLPLFRTFTARIIADVVPQQDETEESPVALRVAALARVITRRGGA